MQHTRDDSALPPQVWLFIVLAFGISWGAYGLRRAGWPEPIDETLALVVKFGPSLAGVIAALAVTGVSGLKDLLSRVVRFRVHVIWYVVALFLPLSILVIALVPRAMLGSITPIGPLGREAVALYGTTLAVRFFAGGGLGEELGWRGFMLPHLQARVGAYNAAIKIGLIHGLWHFPAYGLGVIFLTLFTVAGSIVFTWLYNRTNGSILLPALLHASANASLPWMEAVVPAIDGELLFPLIVFAIWAAGAFALVQLVGREGLGVAREPSPSTPASSLRH